MENFTLAWLLVIFTELAFLYFIYKIIQGKGTYNDALRNGGAGTAYSLAKTQLLWWTLIVVSCFVFSFAHTEQMVVLNSSCLALLGISLGTTTAGKIIDNTEENNPKIVSRHQHTERQSFLTDLISDNNGISLHRFQALMFNLVFGFVFIVEFIAQGSQVLPQFDSTTLGLLGLSSGGYIALKVNENQVSSKANKTTAET